ncbi:MAG TPA: tetratricopeptide repeat protein [Chthonomonadaceae bacterium]|nr:tetratricopeptide repeat protein [Chthonomonadaceae bacterium]
MKAKRKSSAPDNGTQALKAAEPSPLLTPPRKQRSRLGLVALLFVLAGLLIAIRIGQGAWSETQLREAYLPDLEKRAQRDPYNGRLLALLGVRLCQANQYAAAVPFFERAAGAGESNDVLWLTWAAAAAAAGDRTQSWSILKYGERTPSLAPAMQNAIDHCRKLPGTAAPAELAQAIYPQGLEPILDHYAAGSCLNGLSVWYGHKHPEESGFATREQWAKERPDDTQVQTLWGEALVRNRRDGEAVLVLQRLLARAPDALRARLALADALYQGGAVGKAGLEYIACLKAHPDWQPALMGMGRVAVDKKLIAIGIEVYEKAVKQDPNSADAWIGLGRAYMNQRLNLGRALTGFETAAKLAPDRTDFYDDYSDALRVNYRAADAEAILRKRLVAVPDAARTHFMLAATLISVNPTPERLQEAEAELRTALKLEPAGYSSASQLGRLLLQEDRAAEAVPLLESALKADPRDVATTTALVRAFKQVGRSKDAAVVEASLTDLTQYVNHINMLEEQIQRQPGNVKLYRELAAEYASGGEMEKAQIFTQEADALEKHGSKVVNALRTVQQATNNTIPLPERPGSKTP